MPELPPFRFAACCLLLALAPATQAQRDIDTLKQNTERWIEVRNRLAKEEADWRADMSILQSSIETLSSTRDALRKSLAFHQKSIQSLTEKMSEAQSKEQDFQAANGTLAQRIAQYESRILNLVAQLPDPLKKKIAPLVAKIPRARDDSINPLPQRLQNVVAIMTMIDEFNNSLTLSHTIKSLDNGEVIDVRILYWGIAMGFASDATGTKAWLLKPGASGWTWNDYEENAPIVKKAFAIYDKQLDPAIVQLPFELDREEVSR